MILSEVLHLLIEDGIEEARHHDRGERTRGAMDAYAACRGQEPMVIRDILTDAPISRVRAQEAGTSEVQYLIGYEQAVEKVAAVMSCALEYHGLPPITRITVTARLRYGSIVGYESTDATNRQNRR